VHLRSIAVRKNLHRIWRFSSIHHTNPSIVTYGFGLIVC